MNPLPGREALEAELDTVEKPVRPEPKIVAWDHRRRPAAAVSPTLRERIRDLFVRR